MSYSTAVSWVYFCGIPNGVLGPDDSAVREIEDSPGCERSSDDLSIALVRADAGRCAGAPPDGSRARPRTETVGGGPRPFLRGGYVQAELPIVTCIWHVREAGWRSRRAIRLMRSAADYVFRGESCALECLSTDLLVETLLDRGDDGDVAEAEAAIQRLAGTRAEEVMAIRDIWLCGYGLSWHGRTATPRSTRLRDRYRDMARSLGFEGHIAGAEAMP